MDPKLRELNKKVTAAIFRAEHLPPGWEAQVAFREVSEIEEEIARCTASDSLQGSIARRGAVTAALSAGDSLRALSLAEVYLTESAPPELVGELMTLRDEAAVELSKSEVPEVKQVPFELVGVAA
jgi:hypothetical protein